MDPETQLYCPNCGTINYKTNYRCTSCSQVLPRNEEVPGGATVDSGHGGDGFVDPFKSRDLSQDQLREQQEQQRRHAENLNKKYSKSRPPNFLVQAILVTIFCCLPFGIVSIVFAAQVDTLWAQGSYKEAWEASDKARTWGNISFGLGIGVAVLYFILIASTS